MMWNEVMSRTGCNPLVRTKRHLKGCDSRCVVVITLVLSLVFVLVHIKRFASTCSKKQVFRFDCRNEVCKRRDSSERVIEPYAQVVHSSSADKRTVSRVCLIETGLVGGYVWSLGQVYPVGSYTRARM